MFLCEVCGKNFTRKQNLTKHSVTKHGGEILDYSCTICKTRFNDRAVYNVHIGRHLKSNSFSLFRSAFDGTTKIFRKKLINTKSFLDLANTKKDITKLLCTQLLIYPKYKLNISVISDYVLKSDENILEEEFVLKSSNYKITHNNKKELKKNISLCFRDLIQREDDLNLQGSGWVLEEMKFLDIVLTKINILL